MMNFEKSYGTFNIETLAKWYDHPDGGSFLIAPLNNNVQVQETMKLSKVNDSIDNKSFYESKQVSCKVMSKSILINWHDIEDSKGKELKYSNSAAEDVLMKYNDFLTWVLEKAKELEEEQAEDTRETVKN